MLIIFFAITVYASDVYRFNDTGASPNPIVTLLAPTGITTSAATINITTNVSADCQVDYGTTTSYGSSESDTGETTHAIPLTSLSSGTTYHYRVQCTASGATHPLNPPDNEFATVSTPQALVAEYLLNNSGADNTGNGYTLTLAAGGQAPTYNSTAPQSCRSQGLKFIRDSNTYATSTLANATSSWTYCWTMYLENYGASSLGRIFSFETAQSVDDMYVGVTGATQDMFVDVFDSSQRYETKTAPGEIPAIPLGVRLPICITFKPQSNGGDGKVHIYIASTVEAHYVTDGQPTMVGDYKTTTNTLTVGNRIAQDRAFGGTIDDFNKWNYVISTEDMATFMSRCDNNATEGTGVATQIPDETISPTATKTVCAATKCGGGCDYTTITAAVNASSPGWLIKVKGGCGPGTNGEYTEMVTMPLTKLCTAVAPCKITKFDATVPVIDGTGLSYGFFFTSGSGGGACNGVEKPSWWVIDGFEIKNQNYTCISIRQSNGIIRNITCHDVIGQDGQGGIMIDGAACGANQWLIEKNTIYNIGVGATACKLSNKASNWHCHGMYIGNHSSPCKGAGYITVRRNYTHDIPGSSIQMNGASCPAGAIHDVLIENNKFINSGWGFNTTTSLNNIVIKNNTLYMHSHPTITDEATAGLRYIIELVGTITNTLVKNNIFWTDDSAVMGMASRDASSHLGTNFDYNLWKVVSNDWQWGSTTVRHDFATQYKAVTTWDGSGQCCAVDPVFVSGSDWHLQTTSPAKNSGGNAYCAIKDYDEILRPQGTICDIGAFEFH